MWGLCSLCLAFRLGLVVHAALETKHLSVLPKLYLLGAVLLNIIAFSIQGHNLDQFQPIIMGK